MKFGPDDGNSGAIVRWGLHLDNGIWIAWRYWYQWKFLCRVRVRRGYVALGLLSVSWGNP